MIKPDDLKTIPEKGLPFHKQPFKYGNLFIIFKVTFPDTLSAPQMLAIDQAIGPKPTSEDEMTEETV